MKKTLLSLIFSGALSITALSQAVCTSQILNYNGPKSTTELAERLNSSTNPVIVNLSSNIKQTLIDHVVFVNEYPKSMDITESVYMTELYSYSNAEQILSAIFNCKVAICTYATKPVVNTISLSTFMNLYYSDPVNYAFVSVMGWCKNCLYVEQPCCDVGGCGCADQYTELISNGNKYHVVAD